MKWWQRLAAILIRAGKNGLDDSQPVDGLLRFLAHRLQAWSVGKADANPEIAYAYHLAAELGLVSSPEKIAAPHPSLPSREQFDGWHQGLPGERVIDRNGLIPGTGLMLLSILDGPSGHQAFLQTELERLLRRVEIKRRAALALAPDADTSTSRMEQHAVAILFSRAARHFQDLRFLNAALKLNDWAFPSHRRLRSGPNIDRYLWSLAEQETSWKVLMQ